MNVFWLAEDHQEAATYYCDNHLNKIQLEIWEMMSCAIREHWGNSELLWQGERHKHHPLTRWVMSSQENFDRTRAHLEALGHEWKARKATRQACAIDEVDEHNIQERLEQTPESVLNSMPDHDGCQPPLCVADRCKRGGLINSYRLYYANIKWPQSWFDHRGRRDPEWLHEYYDPELAIGWVPPRRVYLHEIMRLNQTTKPETEV